MFTTCITKTFSERLLDDLLFWQHLSILGYPELSRLDQQLAVSERHHGEVPVHTAKHAGVALLGKN
jgi:hypothetical protein